MNNALIRMLLCISAMSIVLLILYLDSSLASEVYRGEFTRHFVPSDIAREINRVDLNYNSFYISGVSDSSVYMGNVTNPLILFDYNIIDKKLNKNKIVVEGVDSVRNPLAA